MANLASALDSAFEAEGVGSSSETVAPEPAAPEQDSREAAPEPSSAAPAPAPVKAEEDEPTGDVLLDKLTPDQIAELKKDPRLRSIYKGLMSSYTPKMQQFAEQQRLWEALNNPETQKQAVEALARSVGLPIQPTDQPQREQAAAVADSISDEWSKVVGPEAAQLLRPLIEKTALQAVNGTLQPLQKATEYLQMDARGRQAEAQVSQFKSVAQEKGWTITPQVEARMAELGQQILPAKAIETVQDGVKHLERLYRLATADTAEADTEKRILERMNKAAQSAEPARGLPSTGQRGSSIPKGTSLNEALDLAMQQTLAEKSW